MYGRSRGLSSLFLFLDPIMCAIKQSLFNPNVIGEEGEDGDASVYDIQLAVEDLHELDDDFSEMNRSLEESSDHESPTKTPTKEPRTKTTSGLAYSLLYTCSEEGFMPRL